MSEDNSIPTDWAGLARETARAWYAVELDPQRAARHGDAAQRWRALLASASNGLPMDAEPAGFARELASQARADAVVIRSQPALAPAVADDPLDRDLTEVAAGLRRGELRAETLTEHALGRLQAAQSENNACVELFGEAALAQARACDRELARGRLRGPLHGVPLAHKDIFYRDRADAWCGVRPRAMRPDSASTRATVLTRLEQSGALDLARLHMTEFAFEPSGANGEIGPCLNPWDTVRVPGGSSSGSGVVVARRAVYAALGTDTGGSIRIPASLCGVTGLKPTWGRVSRYGAMPLSHSNDHIGPLARSAADCALIMQAIAGQDPLDPSSAPRSADGFASIAEGACADLDGLRVGVPERFFHDGLGREARAVIEASRDVLTSLGARIVQVSDFDWEALNALAAMITRVEAAARLSRLNTVGGFEPELIARFEEGVSIPGAFYVQALSMRVFWLRRFMAEVMRDVDCLHAPTCRVDTPAFADLRAGGERAALARVELTVLNRPINYLGLPALSLPCGFATPAGGLPMPVGFQLIGRPFDDERLLAVGAAYQAQTDWHRRAPPQR